ncbi:MAG: hypothetical protein AB3N28_11315 [Kordiimonas sp.]
MTSKITLAALCLWLGILALSITMALHLILGLPPLEGAIENGFIQKAPGIRPQTLLAMWVTFSVINYIALVGLVAERFLTKNPSPIFAAATGMSAIGSAVTINSFVPGHMAVGLLAIPGILIVLSAILEYRTGN